MHHVNGWILVGAPVVLIGMSWGCLVVPECLHCGDGASGTTGGAGGAPECTSDNDCQKEPASQCMKLGCSSGVCSMSPDDSLSPTDDGNPCTTDTCVNGLGTYTNNADPCGNNPPTTHCEGGICTGCVTDDDCDPKTECQSWSCSPGKHCIPTKGPTDLFMDPVGDCAVRSCSDTGVLVVAGDLADIPPSDNNGCTKEECLGVGQPSSTPQEGQACGAGPTCTDGVAKAQDICDTTGGCVAGAFTSCAPFACDAIACMTTCAGSQDCQPTAYCDPGQSTCFDKRPNGADCAAGNQCLSAFCAAEDLVCCSTACTAPCKSCNVGDAPGSCDNLAKGVPDKCANDQACNGTGSCVAASGKSIVGYPCAAAIDCFNYVAGAPSECLNGLCRLHVGQVCETGKPHECDTNLCDALTHTCQECTTNADCPTMACDIANSRCHLADGGTCGAVADCLPGHACISGTCQ